MKIKISNYTIETDTNNYMVSKLSKYPKKGKDGKPHPKAGQEFVAETKFYGTFASALEGLTEARLRGSAAKDLVELRRAIESIHQDISKIKNAFGV